MWTAVRRRSKAKFGVARISELDLDEPRDAEGDRFIDKAAKDPDAAAIVASLLKGGADPSMAQAPAGSESVNAVEYLRGEIRQLRIIFNFF